MSVLACNRNSCPNIMCERLILEGHAYICEDCWRELLHYKKAWSDGIYLNSVRELIEEFMRTVPGFFLKADAETIEKEFERLTGQR